MINKIKNNPTLAAICFFLLTWATFPLVALVRSLIRGVSFAEAATHPYVIMLFVVGSLVEAFTIFRKTAERVNK